ncbi:amino acid ABC transporter ATP-binding protein [Lactobacillaceae bacterium Melli_B4]
MNNSEMLKVEDLKKEFKKTLVLKGINAQVESGQVIALIGPSGAGKSTFLRCLNMLGKPTSGSVFFDGQDLTKCNDKELDKLRTKMGMVFQSFNLFNNMTVLDNVKVAPVKIKKESDAQATELAHKLLKQVGLDNKADVYPSSLSGGQAQRVAIARALAMHPEVMLFDEPTSALDPEKVGEVLSVMQDLAQQGMTMLVVTHEMDFAKNVANQIWFMDDGQIVEKNDPKTFFENPATDRAKDFLSKVI